MNYTIRVKVGEAKHVHVKIFRSLKQTHELTNVTYEEAH